MDPGVSSCSPGSRVTVTLDSMDTYGKDEDQKVRGV